MKTRTRAEINALLVDPGIIAVIRTDRPEQVPAVCEALIAGGVIALEVTLSVPNALQALRSARQKFAEQAIIGVGSVLNVGACRDALNAGAEFVVSPIAKD